MSDGKKKLSFLTVISTIICVVFVCEAAAPAAAIGNQQFFWWIFLILTFLLPYGMVVAELGTTYDGEGGIYDWVRDGLGDKWGARISYYYWVNYPLWIASLATMFPDILGMVFGVEFNLIAKIGIDLAFVWIVYLMGRSKAADSEWVLNGGAIVKVAVAVIVGALGIWYAMENGFANDMSAATFLPELTNTNALGYLSIIIFNFMGFEVICPMTDDMADPARDIPKAIIVGGLSIAVIYLFAGFGIGAAVPADSIDPDYGMIYAGVQKNVGPAGMVVVIIREDLIREDIDPKMPVYMSYKTHADNGSMYNTPNCWAIYCCGKVFKYLKSIGGLEEMHKRNIAKAKVIYDFLDQSKMFKGTVEPEFRSLMNIPFVTESAELDAEVVAATKAAGYDNLKGHKSVGGLRASVYNAMPIEGAQALVEFLKKFEAEHTK